MTTNTDETQPSEKAMELLRQVREQAFAMHVTCGSAASLKRLEEYVACIRLVANDAEAWARKNRANHAPRIVEGR